MTLFHGAFCSAHLFGQNRFWPIMTCFRDILTFFGFIDFQLFGPCCSSPPFSSPRLCCPSLVPASPALEGGKPPNLPPPLHTAKFTWRKDMFDCFRDIPSRKWTLNHLKRMLTGPNDPVPWSILQRASFRLENVWSILTFFGTFSLSSVLWIFSFLDPVAPLPPSPLPGSVVPASFRLRLHSRGGNPP